MRTSVLFVVKNFQNVRDYGGSARTRKIEAASDRRGTIFHDLVRTSFTDNTHLNLMGVPGILSSISRQTLALSVGLHGVFHTPSPGRDGEAQTNQRNHIRL